MTETTAVLADTSAYRPFIRTAGRNTLRRNPTLSHHRPQQSYLLHYLEAGHVEVVWADGDVSPMRQKGACIVPPGTFHSTRALVAGHWSHVHFTVDQNPLWKTVTPSHCFGLRTASDEKMKQPPPEDVWGVALPHLLPGPAVEHIATELPPIINDWLSQDRIRGWRAQDQFARLIRHIISEIMITGAHNTDLSVQTRLARAESVAAQSLHLGVNVNHMARVAGYDRSYFSALYQRVRGESAKQYLARLRLQEAQHLLRTTDQPLRKVASQLGYSDPIVLVRTFRRHTGTTPEQWRRSHRLVKNQA